jgi:hypothetical protein
MAEPGEFFELKKGEGVLVDELGSEAVSLSPGDRAAVLLELGGRLNKSPRRWKGKFLMNAGQAAELIADITLSAARASPDWKREFEQALDREQKRRLAIEGEHGD